jgi:hypothetical protein
VLEKTELPAQTRCEPVDVVDVEDGYTGNLGLVRTYHGTRRRVHITFERKTLMSSAGVGYYNSLFAVVEHLRGGGAVGFSQNHSNTWAGYASGSWSRKASYVAYSGNAFSAWSSAAAPAANQNVVIESAPIFAQSEQHLCTALGGTTQISISPTLTFDYADRYPAMVRWFWFWPALRMPADKMSPPLINEHGINWTLDLTLEVDANIFWAAGDGSAPRVRPFALGDTTLRSRGSVDSLESLLKNRTTTVFK